MPKISTNDAFGNDASDWFGLWNAREDSKSVHTGIQVIAESRVAKSVLGKEGGDRKGLLVHRAGIY